MEPRPAEQNRPAPAALWLRLAAALGVLWASWWLMMASHEAGHALTALLTGGGIDRIDLSPAGFSQTHLTSNPHPLIVAWAGPIVGVLDPLAAWLLLVWLRRRGDAWPVEPVFTFLAGFCLLANGLYLGLGWVDRIGDAGDLLRLGTPAWVMVAFGLLCCAGGIALWHRLGPWLGLARINAADARRLIVAAFVIVTIGFLADALL